MRTISVAERRARLTRRHRLAPAARTDDDDVAAVARSVVVLHATDPATVVPAPQRTLVDREVARLQDRLDDIHVLPRFPAPLDKELAAEVAAS